jgi:hypothetical protein
VDSRLVKALEFSNYRVTLFQELKTLKLKMANDLMYSYNGGTFRINRELISFCQVLIAEDQSETILLDINDTPIFIDALCEFADKIYSQYFEALNEYHIEYERLRKARSVEKIVDLSPLEEVSNEV